LLSAGRTWRLCFISSFNVARLLNLKLKNVFSRLK
jgi:hypothetical protein